MPNISKSKGNQTIKFGQLMGHNMRNIFLKNRTQNVMEILFPDSFLKNQNWAYHWINILKIHTACFYGIPSWGLLEHIETKLQTTCSFPSYKAFLKNKRFRTSLPALFSASFFGEKYLSCYIQLPDQISLSGYLYFVPILRNMCNVTVC